MAMSLVFLPILHPVIEGLKLCPSLVQCADRREPPDGVPVTAGRPVGLLPQRGRSPVAASIAAGMGGSGD
jgi:hypothetical protein